MSEEKDRFGELLSRKKKGDEERFAAEQDRLKLAKLREQAQMATAARGRCPDCGEPLDSGVRDGVEIASCSRGHGLWLQPAALEKVLARVPESELTRWFRALLRS
jgi:hypothetical protein